MISEPEADLKATLTDLGVHMRKEEFLLDPKPMLKLVMARFFGESSAGFVDAMVRSLPSPAAAAQAKIEATYSGALTAPFVGAMTACDAEGLLMVNGDELDFDRGRKQVAHSEPVLCLKGVGGAADFMSQIFDRRRDEQKARDVQDEASRLEQVEKDRKRQELEKASRGVMGTRHLKAQADKYDLELGDIEDTESAIQEIVEAHIFKYREKQKKQSQQQHRRHGRHRPKLGMQPAGDKDPKLKDAAIHKTFRNGRYTFEPREVKRLRPFESS